VPDAVDELYLLPPSEFIAARDRLATKLAAAKERDRAREVKALRRPTVAAWVVNQLAHGNGAALRRLLDAGEALRRAQQRVLRGGSADDLRAAAKRRQEALRDLRSLAEAILRGAGAAAHLDDVLATLEAASSDPAAAKAVTAGRLSKELPRPSGFGEAAPLTLVPRRRTTEQTRPAGEPTKDRAAHLTGARRRAHELAVEAKRLQREAARSQQAAARTLRRAATLERMHREQERRVRQLREELQTSERRLRDVGAELDRARTEASRASERADQLRHSAKAARTAASPRGRRPS
jgi:hypothetical protein